jgi:hypothetical protein
MIQESSTIYTTHYSGTIEQAGVSHVGIEPGLLMEQIAGVENICYI